MIKFNLDLQSQHRNCEFIRKELGVNCLLIMDKDLDIQIEEALKAYLASGVEEQVNYQRFYLYSIVTHSTAIEGSSVTCKLPLFRAGLK